jgi:hypothetical protein
MGKRWRVGRGAKTVLARGNSMSQGAVWSRRCAGSEEREAEEEGMLRTLISSLN